MAKIIPALLFLFCFLPVRSQTDTLEVIESDSTITYVIVETPVTIRDTIKYYVQPPKLYTRIGTFFSLIQNGYTYKKRPEFEPYYQQNANYLSNTISYSVGMSVWNCPGRVAKGTSINLIKLRQHFSSTDSSTGSNFSTTNVTSAAHMQLHLGYKYNWRKKWNFIPELSAGVQYMLSLTGYVVDPNKTNYARQIQITYRYKKITPVFGVTFRSIYSIKGLELECSPYVSFSLINMLNNAPVRYTGYFAGLKVGVSHKLF